MAARSRVTVHMVASLDGFVARKDGSVDWLEHRDQYAGGVAMTPELVEACLASIDCHVLGARTYELALGFEAKGFGWAYGDKPTFVLTHRDLPRTRATVEFCAGDLTELVERRLRPRFHTIWIAGGPAVATECLHLGLVDEICYTIVPILIGDGIPFFGRFDGDVGLHLAKVQAFDNGMVEMHYEVSKPRDV